MDYEKFKDEYMSFENWYNNDGILGASGDDVIFKRKFKDNVVKGDWGITDSVNSPGHYTRGSQEAIVTIEEAIQDAPSPVEGMLQANALKYLLRLWLKENSVEDARKARWYLNRLITSLEQDQ